MKNTLRLLEWQADIVRDDSRIIMVNTSRGGSKTFLLANKVLYEKPKTVLYINDDTDGLRYFEHKFLEILLLDDAIAESVECIRFLGNIMYIQFANGESTTIYDKNFELEEDKNIDMAMFDDGLPQLDIKAKKYISVFTINYPIMKLFNNREDINYYEVGLRHLERGLFTRERIETYKNKLSHSDFIRDIDVCNDYNIVKERWDIVDGIDNIKKYKIGTKVKIMKDDKYTSPNHKGDIGEILDIDYKHGEIAVTFKEGSYVVYNLLRANNILSIIK